MGISRRQYDAARHWKKALMTKEKYAELLNLISEGIKLLKNEAEAERVVDEMFKQSG